MTADAVMEQVATSFVRGRLLVAASRVRLQLWEDRGGLQLLSPTEAANSLRRSEHSTGSLPACTTTSAGREGEGITSEGEDVGGNCPRQHRQAGGPGISMRLAPATMPADIAALDSERLVGI